MELGSVDAMVARAAEVWAPLWPRLALLALACGGLALLWRALATHRPEQARVAGRLALGLALSLGLWRAWQRLSVVDDAFISFRYARHLRTGEGLVFNPGERVEGFTNFLWTVLLAGLAAVGPVEEPHWALLLGLLAYAARVLVLADLGRRLFGGEAYLPLAAIFLALQYHVIGFAGTGLETAAVGLCVELALWCWVRFEPVRGALGLSLCLILATLMRPDAALLYAAFSAAVAADRFAAWRLGQPLREALRPCAAYALPFALWLLVAAWRLRYYGDLYPNTYYAKAADSTYFDQGLVYAASFYLGSQLWAAWLLFGLWLGTARHSEPERAVRIGAVLGLGLHQLWVVKVGGDFMDGRFFVPTVGLLLLGAEGAVWRWLRPGPAPREVWPRPAVALALVCLLGLSAGGRSLIPSGRHAYGIVDEPTLYPVERVFPLDIGHIGSDEGIAFHETMTARGLRPVLATSGIGQLGWYSELEVIDRLGLTDATVARAPHKDGKRGRVGHERHASPAYLAERGVHFIRQAPRPEYRGFTRLKLPVEGKQRWYVFRYDKALMEELARVSPEVEFVHFPSWIRRYAQGVEQLPRERVRRDLAFFDRYYFDHHEDLRGVRARIARRAGRR